MRVLRLAAGGRTRGEVWLPGSKSLSNRFLLLSALCFQPTLLSPLPDSADVAHLRQALCDLGLSLEAEAEGWRVQPVPLDDWRSGELFLGNAGTAMRPLAAVLSMLPGQFVLAGEPRMHERPIGPLVEALRQWGAQIEYLGEESYPPLRIHGRRLPGGVCQLDPTLSSQFVSALLMAAPLLQGPGEIVLQAPLVSAPYVDLTLAQMARFGVQVEVAAGRYRTQPQSYRSPGRVRVEGDATAASYFLAAGAVGGGPVRVNGVGRDTTQGELAFAEVLQQMGARVRWGSGWVECSSPPQGTLRGLDVDLNALPDSAMTLATTALFCQGSCSIRGVENWRVKECDRQRALHDELLKLGAEVEMLADGLKVAPPRRWQTQPIATYGDHRMAMCFSLAALGPVEIDIEDPDCVNKTYPGYFEDFARIRSWT